MAIKENELANVSDISLTDKVRIVTSGGSSNNGRVDSLANTILTKYKSNFIQTYESVYDVLDKLGDNDYTGSGYAYCSTAASTLSKTVSLGTNFRHVDGGVVTIRFYNYVPANSTLSINDTGARPIYYRDTNITDGIIRAGDICTFMIAGNKYVLISKDSPIITETGTTANWKYIKYSDGRVDLSTTLSLAAAEGSQWVSGQPFYYQDTNISLPSGMLTETPSDIVATSGNTQWWIFGVWASNSNTLRARLVKIVSSAQAALVRVRVIGKWR